MSTSEQMILSFASLDFAGRSTLSLAEIAGKLGCSVNHLLNETEHGVLCGIDLKGAMASRRNIRVPIESYRAYVLARVTGPFRADFIKDLPRTVRLELLAEIERSLKSA